MGTAQVRHMAAVAQIREKMGIWYYASKLVVLTVW